MEVIGIDKSTGKDKKVFILKKGLLLISIEQREAEELCKSLASYLNLSLLEQNKLNILKAKANKNSTKSRPLG